MNELFDGVKNICAFIDDLLVLPKISFDEYHVDLNSVLKELKEADLKINAKKSVFDHKKLEYLAYWITREGILPIKIKDWGNFEDCLPNKLQRIVQFYWVG